MKLTPQEVDKLQLHLAAQCAAKRLASGIRLNVPETESLLANSIQELARTGISVAKLMDIGRTLLGKRQVMSGVSSLLSEVQVEACFPDGTKLVTLHNPITLLDGDLNLCLKNSFLPIPSLDLFNNNNNEEDEDFIPGEIITLPGSITINKDRIVTNINITNCSDRPIQVGSHYHLIETNPKLKFDRIISYGKRLNISSGTSVRFEPGESKRVSIVPIGGKRIITGGNNLCSGPVVEITNEIKAKLIEKFLSNGFLHEDEIETEKSIKKQKKEFSYGAEIDRSVYASMYGPTTGDIVRLGDTDLYITVENDLTSYGDECKFGGGKILREGMGQATGVPLANQLDTVITNALIIDYTGIYKADIGIKDGKIIGIGKAGNPDVMNGVTNNMIVGVNTEVIGGEGHIITAGATDTHIHYICPQICDVAIASGITTLLGGGTGPASGTCATTCTPSPNHMKMMMEATDSIPLNFAFTGKGNTSSPEGLEDIINAGAVGLKLHEDWGTTPAAIDNCLSVAEKYDIQVTIHTDTLNESCCVEGSIAAFKGRTIHTYHTEGAGGGHAPDIISVCSHPNVIPSSTNPTRPLTVNTIDEHLDMLMVCHHLNRAIPEDVAFAESRIRQETIAAEDILHDMGALSIMSSDSQAMGRVGEVITRTWQTADKMKKQRGQLIEDQQNQSHSSIKTDNFRVKRFISKYTINPCIAHGMSDIIGSVEIGKLADLVLWKPGFFGAKPEIIIKGGYIAWAQMGDANASIPTPQPVKMRPMFSANGTAASKSSLMFVSKSSVEKNISTNYGLNKILYPIKNTRNIGKKDMKYNDSMPKINVDSETFKVTADDVLLTCEPVSKLPLAQLYFM